MLKTSRTLRFSSQRLPGNPYLSILFKTFIRSAEDSSTSSSNEPIQFDDPSILNIGPIPEELRLKNLASQQGPALEVSATDKLKIRKLWKENFKIARLTFKDTI